MTTTSSAEVRRLASRLAGAERAAKQRGEQLAYSALEDGAIREFSLEGDQVAQYGKQYDGTSTAAVLLSPPPPAPSTPTVTPVAGGLIVKWDGTFENDITTVAPMDWARCDFVAGPVGMDPIAVPPMYSATSPRGNEAFLPLAPGAYDVALVSRTQAGRPSDASAIVTATALPLVDDVQFQQALDDLTEAQGRLDTAEVDITTNEDEIEAAKIRLTTAEQNATDALAAAATAQSTANAAITVFRQSSAPASGMATNDLWFDTDDGRVYIYVGGWQLNDDPRIANALASAALAQATAEKDGATNVNPSFSDWTGSAPAGWSTFVTAPTKEVAPSAYVRTGSYAVRWNCTDNTTQRGLSSTLADLPLGTQYVSVTVDLYVASGTALGGAGVLLDWNGMTGGNRAIWSFPVDIPTPVVGKWYRLSKVLARPATAVGTQTSWTCYVMGQYPMATMAIKDISVDRVAVRAATTEEISAYNAASAATVSTLTTTVNGKTTVFVQTSQPSTSGRTIGDLWLDSDDGNKPYDWTGAWTPRQFGDSALASLDLNKLVVVGTANVNQLVANEIAAKTAAIQTADIGNLFVSGTSTLNKLVAKQIAGEIAEFVTVRANNLESTLALVTMITSGGTGRRWEADNLGIRVFEADGTILINFPTDPSTPASFYGDLVATSLTISDQLAIRGLVNEISKGAQVVLAGGTTAPTSAPTVTIDWENYVASVDGGAYGFDPYRNGWSKYAGKFYTVQQLYGQPPSINRYDAATGAKDFWSLNLDANQSIWTTCSSVMVGNVMYVLGLNVSGNAYNVQGWNVDTGVKVTQWAYPHVFGTSGTAHRRPQLAYDGTNLVIAFTNYADNKIQWRKYAPTTGVQQGSTVIGTAVFAREMYAFWIGTGDFGATKAIVVAADVANAYVLDAAGAPDTNNYFPLPSTKIYGLTYDTGNFYSFDAVGAKFYKHTAIKWTTESPVWYVSNTWYDGDATGGTHETAQSPRKTFTMLKRARLNLSTAVLPVRPIPNTTDDAKAARVYLGRGATDPGRTYMELQSTLADGVRNATLTAVTLPVGAALAVTPPPATSNFPPSSPGRVVSADGTTIVLNGDGSYTMGRIARDSAGVTTITDSTWTVATLTAPWVAFGSGLRTPGYRRKLNGEVQLRGMIKSGAAGGTIFTLPVGMRPTEPETFICAAGGPGAARVDVSASGVVSVNAFIGAGTNSYVSLSGISFDSVA